LTLNQYGDQQRDLTDLLTIALANAFKQLPSVFRHQPGLGRRSIISSNQLEVFIYRTVERAAARYLGKNESQLPATIFANGQARSKVTQKFICRLF